MIEFSNAQELQQQYPDTFSAPSLGELSQLKPGDVVKVSAFKERFWTKIIEIHGDNIMARMENDIGIPYLRYGDTVTFRTCNIYAIR